MPYDTPEPETDETWRYAVICSYQALDDEKKAQRALAEAYSMHYVRGIKEADLDRAMEPQIRALKEVQDRIKSWQTWFKTFTGVKAYLVNIYSGV